ncbi:hypothetical protein H0H81_008791 [Sphagnurus paluster]|uniref:Uncharacterized protein n=1 Tax=Sphagnurus paluster TaxID=117069 RepID=A0A9P7K468_9AGAR|nr:hypothetical protein H0H81_008791 [Sphagnurus paluster]
MDLSIGGDAWIFQRLIVPQLAALDIRCDCRMLETSKLIAMIARSGCALKRLSFPADLHQGNYEMDTPARDLLALLPQVVKLVCNRVALATEELQDIGMGVLIRRIDVFECAVESPKAYLEMIKVQHGRGGSLVVGHACQDRVASISLCGNPFDPTRGIASDLKRCSSSSKERKMRLPAPLFIFVFLASLNICIAGPKVTLTSNSLLDPSGIFFVSYDGVVNVNSFQLSGVLTYGNYQFAAWYTSSRAAVLARRQLPNGSWSTLALPHMLSVNDSHNVIALGVSPQDGKIHVAMDCHSSAVYYTSSEAGLATNGASWTAGRFGAIVTTLGGLNIGTVVTYPQFVVTPDKLLQMVYRSGVSANGATQLAEYARGVWTNVGSRASASGVYTAPSSATSAARNLYIHGFTYSAGRLHVTGTWREQAGSVSCSGGGLTNHDTTYFYSDDKCAWLCIRSSSCLCRSHVDADHGLMNNESQDVDSAGQIHAIISYVPGRFTQCVTNYQADRTAYGRTWHVYRSSSGSFTEVEIPFPINAVGRSQIVMDAADNVYVILPCVKIVTASKASGWTDWSIVYDGVAAGLNAFGEVTVDRARVASGVLSVLYQEKSMGTTPSAVRIVDFALGR